MPSPLERRRFSRFIVPLTVQYLTHCPVSGEPCRGHGVLRDISLSGGFFHLDHDVTFKPGQVISLTIAAPLPFMDNNNLSHLKAEGEVVRLEPAGPNNPNLGVAVSFLNGLSFASA